MFWGGALGETLGDPARPSSRMLRHQLLTLIVRMNSGLAQIQREIFS
jgi:hypothetical protein